MVAVGETVYGLSLEPVFHKYVTVPLGVSLAETVRLTSSFLHIVLLAASVLISFSTTAGLFTVTVTVLFLLNLQVTPLEIIVAVAVTVYSWL